jgi:hypothetical protein
MTIGKKLTLNFVAMLALVLVSSGVVVTLLRSLGGALNVAVNSTAKKLAAAGSIRAGFQEVSAYTRATHLNYVIRELERGRKDSTCGACHDEEKLDKNRRGFETALATLQTQFAALRPLVDAADERNALGNLERAAGAWSQHYHEYLEQAGSGHFEAAHQIVTDKMYPILADVQLNTVALAGQENMSLEAADSGARRTVSTGRWAAFLVVGLSLAISIGVLLVVRHTIRVLREVTCELKEGAEQIARASSQVSAASQSVAEGASRHASSIEEANTLGGHVQSSAQTNVENSKRAELLTETMGHDVGRANETLSGMVAAIDAIDCSSQQISRIIKVIQEIAFQTNLLALNAAVEAARAGESGRGFAVVADEVRKLAQRCAQAATETTALIEESIEKTRFGKAQVESVNAAVRSVTEGAANARAVMAEVRRGVEAQASDTGQIAGSIAEMERATQSAAANAEESASAGEELHSQSQSLMHVVSRLTELCSARR